MRFENCIKGNQAYLNLKINRGLSLLNGSQARSKYCFIICARWSITYNFFKTLVHNHIGRFAASHDYSIVVWIGDFLLKSEKHNIYEFWVASFVILIHIAIFWNNYIFIEKIIITSIMDHLKLRSYRFNLF